MDSTNVRPVSVALLLCMLALCVPCRADEAPAKSEPVSLKKIREMRKEAAQRKRRIIFHSDGKPMDSENMRFPYIPGTQTDSCTYSLVHQFNLVRFYKTEVGQPWPPGYLDQYREKHGDGPSDLDRYIALCRTNNYEAFWAQRMNDTHDAAYSENGRWKFANNEFKQEHPDWLLGRMKRPAPGSPDGKWVGEDFYQCPYGRWSGVDYTHEGVRDQVFRTWEEVCKKYDIDGLMLDFFRHPTSFRTTALGGHATDEERELMTGLLKRTRRMADKLGAKRGRPILLIARAPDEPRYARALGLDIERWMAEDLIDIWLATGYFRLQEWTDIVALGRKHGVPVWASMDEVRTKRLGCNSPAAYRARAMNMWSAGVDGIYLFNFSYKPPTEEFNLLNELGEPGTLAHLTKMYVPDPRSNRKALGWWLKGGEEFVTRTTLEILPLKLDDGEVKVINMPVGDDIAAAVEKGLTPTVKLYLYFNEIYDANTIALKLNGQLVKNGGLDPEKRRLLQFQAQPELVKKGSNRFEVRLLTGGEYGGKSTLADLQMWISYK